MYGMLGRLKEGIRSDVIEFAQSLVRTPSTSLHEEKVADQVENVLNALGWNLVYRDDAGNVVGVLLQGDTEPTVLLNCHMDTVAPDEESRWEDSPYAGEVRGRRLHGLGAADCKGGLASQIFGVHLLNTSLLPLRGNVVVAATVAEENGCSVGLDYLLENTLPQLGIRPMFALLGEPTSLGLCGGHDGWVVADLRLRSKSPTWLQESVATALSRLEGPGEDRCNGRVITQVLSPRYEETPEGRIATIQVARRLYPGESGEEYVLRLGERARGWLGNCAGTVETSVHEEEQQLYTSEKRRVRLQTAPWSTDPYDPHLARAREALLAAGKPSGVRPWRIERLGMGTAGSLLVNKYGIPTIGFGPGDEAQAHAGNESVDIDDLTEAAYGTAVLVHSLLGVPALTWGAS